MARCDRTPGHGFGILTDLNSVDLTVLDLALSTLRDMDRRNPSYLPTPELKRASKQLHTYVLKLKGG